VRLLACSHLGGFFLFLYLAVAEPTAKVTAAAGAGAAQGIVTFVLASANSSWSSWETSSNSVSNEGIFSTFPFPFQVWTFFFCTQSCSTHNFVFISTSNSKTQLCIARTHTLLLF
jgi:hypothetical protein